MKKTLLMLLFATLLFSASAKADTVYTYTGNDFTNADWTGNPPGYISGSITLATPLTDNMAPGTDISSALLAATFVDNYYTTLTYPGNLSVGTLTVGTDATGSIDYWVVEFCGSESYWGNCMTTEHDSNGTSTDKTMYYTGYGNFYSANSQDPGQWECTLGCPSDPTPTPEPGTLGLMLMGLGMLGLVMRKRIGQGLPLAR